MGIEVILLLILHLMSDFLLQPESLVKNKFKKWRFVFLHGLIYAAVFGILFILYNPRNIWLPYIIITGSHFLVDCIKVGISKKKKEADWGFWMYLADQVIHIAVILITAGIIFNNEFSAVSMSNFARAAVENAYSEKVLKALLALLALGQPVSLLVKHLFSFVFGSFISDSDNNRELEMLANTQKAREGKLEPKKRSTESNAGNVIGYLERIIVVMLIAIGQPGSIGFVLTAKSIARFKNFEEEGFAEKYLVGTFVSIGTAVLVGFLLF